jgi:hypothetical protein
MFKRSDTRPTMVSTSVVWVYIDLHILAGLGMSSIVEGGYEYGLGM